MFPSEVIVPRITAGMEEWNYTSRFRVNAREIRAFVQVAPIASQREIGGIIAATMLPGYHMFDVKRRKRH